MKDLERNAVILGIAQPEEVHRAVRLAERDKETQNNQQANPVEAFPEVAARAPPYVHRPLVQPQQPPAVAPPAVAPPYHNNAPIRHEPNRKIEWTVATAFIVLPILALILAIVKVDPKSNYADYFSLGFLMTVQVVWSVTTMMDYFLPQVFSPPHVVVSHWKPLWIIVQWSFLAGFALPGAFVLVDQLKCPRR